jgi:hypothetical protein
MDKGRINALLAQEVKRKKELEAVKAYIFQNPLSNAMMASADTGITVDKFTKFAVPDQKKLYQSKQEKDDVSLIKEYLKQHPLSNAMDISRATGVSVSKIIQFAQQVGLYSSNQSPPQNSVYQRKDI